MKEILKSFSLSFKMIVKDPVNLMLALFPSMIALIFYFILIYIVYSNSPYFSIFFEEYLQNPEQASIVGKILAGILIVFVFFLMSWTFVILVGIIGAPFNSLLSSRIENSLLKNSAMEPDQGKALSQFKMTFFTTLMNELKKILFLSFMGLIAFLLNLIPVLSPIAVVLIALLLTAQFVDYSWSRHELSFSECLKDIMKNIIPYFFSGVIFLGLVAIPLVNALIPSIATSFFTVLWFNRQNNIHLLALEKN